jgi:hypothetical protein
MMGVGSAKAAANQIVAARREVKEKRRSRKHPPAPNSKSRKFRNPREKSSAADFVPQSD